MTKPVDKESYHELRRSKPRIDGTEKVTGRALYAGDMYKEGMLYAGVLRSPYSSARVTRIDAERARAIEGVEAVVTFQDLKKTKSWAGYMYLTDHIRYVGDCVAMVAAQSKALVDEALEAIEVEYEELPGVYTIEEALAEGAPLVHEEYKNNIFTDSYYPIRKGDVEKGFAQAEVIIEREYQTQYIEHSYIEPEAALAYPDPNNGIMTVYASAQNPFFTRRYIADILDVPLNKVHLVQAILGGSFGGKEEGAGLVAARAAYLSYITDKPVKLVFSREDSFLESAKRHPFRLRYKIGAMKNGKIVAFEGEQVDNCGAYNNQTQFMNSRASIHSSGPYEIENIKTDTYGVFTNNIHSGAMRGYSSPSLIFGQEQLIEELAETLGIDEVELRRINCLKEGSLTTTGVPVHHVMLQEIMDNTVAETDYVRKHALYKKQTDPYRRKGIGMIICYRGCGLGAESPDASGCMMIANEDGSVSIASGLAENGQGLKTAYAQIAAEALGVHYEDVQFPQLDTFAIADSGMTVASRGTVMGAQSVRKAGEKLKQIMIRNAITLHSLPVEEAGLSWDDIHEEDIELCDARFYLKKHPEVSVEFKAVTGAAVWAGVQMAAYEWYMPPALHQDHDTGQGTTFPDFGYACIVAEVEVDMRTGYVDVQKVTSSHDVGVAINPALVKGQIYGGIVMGQGYGVMEDVAPSHGRVKNRNFNSYIIPTSMDAPEMKINIYESGDPAGTYGAKSIGEPATEGITAAIANAVYNATGRRIWENPCDLESVLLGKKLRK
ncbi:MAG: xanthine dehydrogenase family protein molybdopterin-binding subunit [Lachnospiraceae bacterium]|nr:xanthine dehydrogenase family protein molybdopterin-binding subunit [Lachnospiraceae bacterium]